MIYLYLLEYKFLRCYEKYNYIGRGVCTKLIGRHEVANKNF